MTSMREAPAAVSRFSLGRPLSAVRARALRTGARLQRSIMRRMLHPSGESRPAFIVGCGRSGTSMLIFHLARTWQVEAYNEDNPAAFHNFRLRDLDTVERLVRDSRAPLTLFKPILSTTLTPSLLQRFPECRVLFVARHYSDVIHSSLRRFGRENRLNHVRAWMAEDFAEFSFAPPPEGTRCAVSDLYRPDLTPEEGAALYWLFYNRLYFDLGLDAEPRVCLVRYESLVEQPEHHFRAIAKRLGIAYTPAMAQGVTAAAVGRSAPPTLSPDIQDACDGLWRELCDVAASAPAQAPPGV